MPVRSVSRRVFAVGLGLVPFAFAQPSQKTIDKRNSSEAGEYALGFASKASDGIFDHAFMIWYYSDPQHQRSVRRGAGFYPVANEKTKLYDLVLGITGKVFDDSKVKVSQELTVLINKDVFDRALAVEGQYKNNQTYHLAFGDCTTFVNEVAAAIPGLRIPSRLAHIYPSDFVKALYDEN